ncbi:MAG: hypothetical protein GX102_08295 [Porphyromonadaceae bacterium]|jgi:thioredoxin-related protein|nr:hypothetical protein [Porphyromonadaceae bacterium]
MKRILLLSTLFLICFVSVKSEKSAIIQNILKDHVAQQVEKRQNLIKFTNAQAIELKDLELKYLLNVQRAENCRCCNTKKRVAKLRAKRDEDLQKILTREQYIKYDAIDRNTIIMNPRE